MTQITVEFVNRPGKNPKFGSIKSTDGVYYSIGADVVDRYKKGMTFDAPVSSREWQGKTYYSIPDSFDPSVNSTPAPQTNKPAMNGHAGGCNKDILITATALMKSFIEGGQFGLTDLPALESACVAAARRIVGASQ